MLNTYAISNQLVLEHSNQSSQSVQQNVLPQVMTFRVFQFRELNHPDSKTQSFTLPIKIPQLTLSISVRLSIQFPVLPQCDCYYFPYRRFEVSHSLPRDTTSKIYRYFLFPDITIPMHRYFVHFTAIMMSFQTPFAIPVTRNIKSLLYSPLTGNSSNPSPRLYL